MSNILYKRVSKSGAIGIPASLRRQQGLQSGDAMEITVTEDNKIIIQPYQLRCYFCDTTDNVHNFHGKGVCKTCISMITDMKEER